ncbi:MAG: DUF5658 family protein [bacterium]|nr:DUF5658 family protein [bacterium]
MNRSDRDIKANPAAAREDSAADAGRRTDRLEHLRVGLGGLLHAAWNRELPLQTETSFFILVNVLDFFLTLMLITFGAFETNPVADYFFRNWGFRGMLAYKLASVAFVCLLSQYVARISLAKARFILLTGIALVGGVVVYSAWLLSGLLR